MKKALPAPHVHDEETLSMMWSESAIEKELEVIQNEPYYNPNKADSPLFKSMIRMAAIAKGDKRQSITFRYIYFALIGLKNAGKSETLVVMSERDIIRQLTNAFKMANKRSKKGRGKGYEIPPKTRHRQK